MLYDITRKETFDNLEEWLKDIIENLGQKENYLIILLGNKLDIAEQNSEKREVEESDAKKYCMNNNILWGGECSVKDFDVDRLKSLFKEFIEEMYKKVGDCNVKEKVATLSKSNAKKKKGFC